MGAREREVCCVCIYLLVLCLYWVVFVWFCQCVFLFWFVVFLGSFYIFYSVFLGYGFILRLLMVLLTLLRQ